MVIPIACVWRRFNKSAPGCLSTKKRSEIPDLAFYHTFVRALFFHRRKFLRSVLNSAFKQELEKSDVDAVLGQSRFHAELRAEQLQVEEIQELSELFRQKVNEKKNTP